MTLVAVVAGDNTGTTSVASFTCRIDIDVAVGDVLVVCIAADNAGSSGASSIASVSDNRSNYYFVGALKNKGNAMSPNDSGTCAVFVSRITSALIPADFVTINFSPATTSKAVVLWKVSSASGSYTFPTPTTDNGYGVQGGWSSVSVTSGDMVIGVCAFESADSSISRDTDTAYGTWSNPLHTATANKGGVHSSSQAVSSQWKVPSTTGTQQYANLVSSSVDWESIALLIHEDPTPPPVAFSGAGTLRFTGLMYATQAPAFSVMASGTVSVTGRMVGVVTRSPGAHSFGSVVDKNRSQAEILTIR